MIAALFAFLLAILTQLPPAPVEEVGPATDSPMCVPGFAEPPDCWTFEE